MLVQIILTNSRVYQTQDNLVSSGVDLNTVLARFSIGVRESADVALKYPEASASPAFTTGTQTLILRLQTIKSDGTPDFFKSDYIIFSIDPAKSYILKEQLIADPISIRKNYITILTTHLSSVTFEYKGVDDAGVETTVAANLAERVKATVSIITKTGALSKSVTSSTTVSLRN